MFSSLRSLWVTPRKRKWTNNIFVTRLNTQNSGNQKLGRWSRKTVRCSRKPLETTVIVRKYNNSFQFDCVKVVKLIIQTVLNFLVLIFLEINDKKEKLKDISMYLLSFLTKNQCNQALQIITALQINVWTSFFPRSSLVLRIANPTLSWTLPSQMKMKTEHPGTLAAHTWHSPFLWQWSTPSIIDLKITLASSSGSLVRSCNRLRRSPFDASSIIMKNWCLPSIRSCTRITFLWFSHFRISISLFKNLSLFPEPILEQNYLLTIMKSNLLDQKIEYTLWLVIR